MSGWTREFDSEGRQRIGRAYRTSRVWTSCAYTATVLGLVCAVASWGWVVMLTGLVTMAIVVATIAGLAYCEEGIGALPKAVRVGAVSATYGTGAAGLVAALEISGLVVVLALVVTCPAVIAAARSALRASNGAQETAPSAPPVPLRATGAGAGTHLMSSRFPDTLESLDDAALCQLWRHSFVLLEGARSPEERMAVVQHREHCLDELQRRCPDGVAAWLSSGARAAGNPLPFLDPRRRRSA